jgi:hypothetical protein
MMVPAVVMAVLVAVFPAVSATFGLKSGLDFCELRAEAAEHVLDYMVGPNTENLIANFSRQMPVSEVPSKTHKLVGIFVPDFDNVLRSGLNHQPPPIFQLQAISIGHGNGFRKIEKDIFAFVRSQANPAAMARVKIKRESACNVFLRPMAGGAMNGSGMHDPSQYMK